jgi:type II secretory pathway pseudopilin PulG
MKNSKGYTIIEAVIAMLLVSVVVGGIFSALMASRRAIIDPSYKEDMVFAVESANNLLKNYVTSDKTKVPTDLKNGLCDDGTVDALSIGSHDIECLLPPVCEPSSSTFTYTVSDVTVAVPDVTGQNPTLKSIKFNIMCNREVL